MRTRFTLILLVSCLLTAWLAVGAWAQDATTPTAPATPTAPTAAVNVVATVDTGGPRLRVRGEPTLAAPIVARLTNGSVVEVLASDATRGWVLVPLTNAATPYGWVSTTYLRLSAPVTMLPVATATPSAPLPPPSLTPTSTVTATLEAAPTATPVEIAVAPPPSGLYGKLAVPVFDEQRKTYDVWLVNADGSELRRVMEEASSPALSDDGALLAYRRWKVDDRGIVVALSLIHI